MNALRYNKLQHKKHAYHFPVYHEALRQPSRDLEEKYAPTRTDIERTLAESQEHILAFFQGMTPEDRERPVSLFSYVAKLTIP